MGSVHRLAEVFRHAESIFPREPLGDLAELGVAGGRAHVKIDVVDLQARAPRPLDLRAQLLFDFFRIGVVLVQRFGGLEEVSISVDQGRHGCAARHRSPAIVFPFGIQRQMNAHRDVGMPLEDVHGFLVPGAGKHHRDGHGEARVEQSLHAHVDAVTHADVVGADDQVDRIG